MQLLALDPMKTFTKIIQGTAYVTISLIIPLVCGLIEQCDPRGKLVLDDGSLMEASPTITRAREALYEDLKHRWLVVLPLRRLEDLFTCTVLDPRFKNLDFSSHITLFDNGAMTKQRAYAWAEAAFEADYAPKLAAEQVIKVMHSPRYVLMSWVSRLIALWFCESRLIYKWFFGTGSID